MNPVPEVITRYYEAAARDDVDELIACFTDDAWVVDEDHRHEGKDAIRAWRQSTSSAYTYTTDVRDVIATGDGQYRALTHVEGTFPGGEVDLSQDFTLRDGLISSLEI